MLGAGQLHVDFEFVNKPANPTGHVKREHVAKAKTGEFCEKCSNSLLCVSGPVAVQQCRNCMRSYVDGSLIPDGVACEGFIRQPQVFVSVCEICAEEHVRKYLAAAIEPLTGTQLTPHLIAQARENLKAQAHRLFNDFGWEINVDVVCEDS